MKSGSNFHTFPQTTRIIRFHSMPSFVFDSLSSGMPPKKPPLGRADVKKHDVVEEPPLQAVILADSYNRRFEVLCTEQPRVLLPLCSTPLLAWTLESLSLSKVKQVFVFCGAHTDKVKEFVR